MTPYPVSLVYGATKAGFHSYTQSLRVRLQDTPVRVFELLAPSAKTPLIEQFIADMKESSLKESNQVRRSATACGSGLYQTHAVPVQSIHAAITVLLLFPQTFFLGNLLNAAGFLLLSLALIWLKHPWLTNSR